MIRYAFIERYSIVTSYSLINLMGTVEMWEVFFFLRSSLALTKRLSPFANETQKNYAGSSTLKTVRGKRLRRKDLKDL